MPLTYQTRLTVSEGRLLKLVTVGYRPDIDGIRAIAVMAVVLFHLGIKRFSGGFVGVDIFFVISGYLICRTILTEITAGSFSILHFYERRARRIMPAFFFVSALTTVAAFHFFFPSELVAFANSLIASVLFVPNIFFFATTGYFAQSADAVPLLHYWSLGVEEQFYIIFPLAIAALHRAWPRSLGAAIFILMAASFAASVALTRAHPAMGFFLLPFRAFELLIGSALALPAVLPPKTGWQAIAATASGLCAMATSIFAFSPMTVFPGYAASLPCIGAVLVLWGGAGSRSWLSRLLATWPLRLVGKISYSLYLVHWPIIVFGTLLTPDMKSLDRDFLLFGLSITAALVSFYVVEQPVRLSGYWTRTKIFALTGTAILLPFSLATAIVANQGFPLRFNSQVLYAASFLQYDSAGPFREGRCFLKNKDSPGNFDSAFCLPETKGKRAILWGDSTAADLYSGLAPIFRQDGYTLGQATASGCAPIIGYDPPTQPGCLAFNNFILGKILAEKPDILILSSSWVNQAHARPQLVSTLEKLKAAGINTVILGPQPFYASAVPRIIATRLLAGNHSIHADGQMLPQTLSNDAVMAAISAHQQMQYISIVKAICPQNNCVLTTDGGVPIEFDVLHLTTAGSNFVGTRIMPSILASKTTS